MRRVVLLWLCGLLIMAGWLAGPLQAAEAPLRFAVLAFRAKPLVAARWQAFGPYLEKALARPVRLEVLTLDELDAAVAAGSVDVVLTNSGDYVLLKRRFNLSAPLATMVTLEAGQRTTQFGGVIFVRSDDPRVHSLQDLAGRRIAAASLHSLGGYQMQAMEMILAGGEAPPPGALDIVGVPQDRVVTAVLEGRAEVGFVRTGVLEHMAQEGKLDLARIRLIAGHREPGFPYWLSTRLYPEWPVAVLHQVDGDLATRLTVALLSLQESDPVARAAGISGFTIPANYTGVEAVLQHLRMPPFDEVPQFTLADLWARFAPWIVALAVLAAALVAASGGMAVYARRARQASRRFAALFEASPEPIWILSGGRYVDCNNAGALALGVADKQALIGRGPADFSPPQQPGGESSTERARALLEVARYSAQHFEWRHQRVDGSCFDGAVSLTPLVLGARPVLLVVLHDISALKAVERALREAELFARATLDAVGARLGVLDREGRVIAINQDWRDGVDDQPVPCLNPACGVGCAFLTRCDEAAATGNALAAALATGVRGVIDGSRDSFAIEYPGNEAHAQRWFSLHASRFQGDSGNVVLTVKSISERKQWELRLRHHNRILAMLASRKPLHQLLTAIAEDVETLSPGALCGIQVLDADGVHLRDGAGPSLPDDYRRAVDGAAIGPTVGSCGAAAFLNRRVVVADIHNNANWAPYRSVAEAAGLRSCWSQPVVSAGGRVLGTLALYHREPSTPGAPDLQLIEDEAHLVALAIELSAAEERLQRAASVFTSAREGILITDRNGAVIEVNEAFEQLTGYSRTEMLGQNPRILKSGRQGPEFYAAMWQALAERGHWSGEVWNRRKSGEVYAELLTISAVRDAQGGIASYVALFTDITHIKAHQKALERIAHYDALTGLPNRVLLADRLSQAMHQCERNTHSLAVLYLDLDGFKAVNDQHGHDIGDELLVAVSQRMKATLRQGDTLARIGGDEFVVVLTQLAQQRDCDDVVGRLLLAVSNPMTIHGATLHISASIGVTMYPEDHAEPDVLLRHADQAMYAAKQAGKNRHHHFDVARDAALKSQFESVEKIRQALQRGEFELFYQPKVDLASGQMIGAEALIRWRHPERGVLRPAAFLPLLEGHSLELDFGDWVLHAALGQMERWHAVGLVFPVSVNVSAAQLQSAGFVAQLGELLGAHPQLAPGLLELEVLESSAVGDLGEVSGVIRACRSLGVRFALDDFGTGYSSLVYLKRLPVDVVKIDQSFIRNILDDPESRAIVEGVVSLTRAFHREAVAEGVESAAQASVLKEIGCLHAQGFGIARPMPAGEVEAWARGRGVAPVALPPRPEQLAS